MKPSKIPTYSEISQKVTGFYDGDHEEIVPDTKGRFNSEPISAITGYDFVYGDGHIFDNKKQNIVKKGLYKPDLEPIELSSAQKLYADTWQMDNQTVPGVYHVSTVPINVLINTKVRTGENERYVKPMFDILSRQIHQPHIIYYGAPLYYSIGISALKSGYLESELSALKKRGYRLLTDATIAKNDRQIAFLSVMLQRLYQLTLLNKINECGVLIQQIAEYIMGPANLNDDLLWNESAKRVIERSLTGICDYVLTELSDAKTLKERQKIIETYYKLFDDLLIYINDAYNDVLNDNVKQDTALFTKLTSVAHKKHSLFANVMSEQDDYLLNMNSSWQMLKQTVKNAKGELNDINNANNGFNLSRLDIKSYALGNYLVLKFNNKLQYANFNVIIKSGKIEHKTDIYTDGQFLQILLNYDDIDLNDFEIILPDNVLHFKDGELQTESDKIDYYLKNFDSKPIFACFNGVDTGKWLDFLYNQTIIESQTATNEQKPYRTTNAFITDSVKADVGLDKKLVSGLGMKQYFTIITKDIDKFAKQNRCDLEVIKNNIGLVYDFTKSHPKTDNVEQYTYFFRRPTKVYLPIWSILNKDTDIDADSKNAPVFDLKKQLH